MSSSNSLKFTKSQSSLLIIGIALQFISDKHHSFQINGLTPSLHMIGCIHSRKMSATHTWYCRNPVAIIRQHFGDHKRPFESGFLLTAASGYVLVLDHQHQIVHLVVDRCSPSSIVVFLLLTLYISRNSLHLLSHSFNWCRRR